MKKTVWVCGLIGGLIVSASFIYHMFVPWDLDGKDMTLGMVYGFASMFLAFSLIFVGIKTYRDNHLGGYISFGKAFRIGLYISLIASTMYVIAWQIYFYNFGSAFTEWYTNAELTGLREAGATPKQIADKTAEMAEFSESYKNPLFNAALTYMEILPLGLVLSLVAALIMKRKPRQQQGAVAG